MINKKTIPVAVFLLLVAAITVAGATQVSGYKTAPGQVVVATGAPQSTGNPYPELATAPALSAPTGQVTFSDSFSSASGWALLPGTEGVWKVLKTGVLQQSGSTLDGEVSNENSVYFNSAAQLGDGVYEAQVYPTSGDPAGVVFRGTDASYYRVLLLPHVDFAPSSEAHAVLQKVTGDSVVDIASNTSWAGVSLNTWQTVRVDAVGSHITVSVDGTKLLDANDSSLSSGWIGVWTLANRSAKFDNIRVQRGVAGR